MSFGGGPPPIVGRPITGAGLILRPDDAERALAAAVSGLFPRESAEFEAFGPRLRALAAGPCAHV